MNTSLVVFKHNAHAKKYIQLLAEIRHCITDIWNLLTHLQFPVNAANLPTCEGMDGVWVGGSVASTHLATCFGCALKSVKHFTAQRVCGGSL